MPLETSAEKPIPVRTALRLVGEWIGRLGRVWVEGQIAELSRRGGTVYLTLRDPVATVSVRVICPRQVFDAERKRRPSFLPGLVGLICGRDSAAERDVLQNAARRWPSVRFRVEQVAVQGPYAATEITDALHALDADTEVDVIIITRGGGSTEDLLPFSDESVVRAVAACRTPVVSAIGPELRSRARRQLAGRLDREAAWLAAIRSRPVLASPAAEIDRRHEQVLALAERARRCMAAGLARAEADLDHTRARLIALSPAATLRRGYAIVQRSDATVVRSAQDVVKAEPLLIRLATGHINVTVSE